MPEDLAEGTTITCPLCRGETTTVERNKQDKPYFYCAEYEAAVNMNAPAAHTESFLREFVVEEPPSDGESGDSGSGGSRSGGSGSGGSSGGERRDGDPGVGSEETDIQRRE